MYPVYSDILTHTQAAGIDIPASGYVTDVISEVVEMWNGRVGYTFLNTSATSGITYYDYPANGYLYIPYHTSISSVSLNGSPLVLNESYWVYDNNEIFLRPDYYGPKSVAVAGVLGYTSCPQRVFNMIVEVVAYKLLTLNPQRNFTKMEQGDVKLWLGPTEDITKRLYRLARSYAV